MQFITISAVIGVMIFYSNGAALEVAGPSGALLAFALVGIITICVMECVSEFIQMFPTPNAIVEFVRIFVDKDLAWVVGLAYWLASLFTSISFYLDGDKVHLHVHFCHTNHSGCSFFRILGLGSVLPDGVSLRLGPFGDLGY